jgi:hypothetical protein
MTRVNCFGVSGFQKVLQFGHAMGVMKHPVPTLSDGVGATATAVSGVAFLFSVRESFTTGSRAGAFFAGLRTGFVLISPEQNWSNERTTVWNARVASENSRPILSG